MKTKTLFISCVFILAFTSCKTYKAVQRKFDGAVIPQARADSMQKYLWQLISEQKVVYDPASLNAVKYKPSDLRKLFCSSVGGKRDYTMYFLPAAIRAEDTAYYSSITHQPGDSLLNRITTIAVIKVHYKPPKGPDPITDVYIAAASLCPPPRTACVGGKAP